jgi:hypothetical protein
MASVTTFLQGKQFLTRLGGCLTATALTCAGLAAVPNSALAASVTTNISSGTPTVIVTLNKGETVKLTLTLTTTDPNESGEGEPVTISYGGNTTTWSEYDIPDTLSITATTDGETVSGWIQGADGDESATVTAEINPNPLASEPNQAKQVETKIALGTGVLSGGFWTCAELVPIFTAPTAVAKTICGVSAAVFALTAAGFAALAADPADPNYKVLAKPQPFPAPALSGIPYPERAPLSNLVINLQEQRVLSNAALTSFNRAAGAVDAGSTFWATKQRATGIGYLHQIGLLLEQEPGFLSNVVTALHAGGIADFTITPDQVLTAEADISQNGVPADIAADLTKLGADSTAVAQAQQIVLSRNVNDVAGTYFDKLTDPAFIASLRSAAQTLLTTK